MLVSLHIPDDVSWQNDPDYSFTVASTLIRAFRAIRANHTTIANYADAYSSIEPLRNSSMSPIQRQHLFYLLSVCCAAQNDFPTAIDCLDEVLEISAKLEDGIAFAESLYLRGSTLAIRSHFRQASVDFALCLELLYDMYTDAGPADTSLELSALLGQASAEFMLANHKSTMDLLEDARSLLQALPQRRYETAVEAWLRAQVYRWSGLPGQALAPAMQAADLLAGLTHLESSGRIQTIVADIALDYAETFAISPPHYAEASLVNLAGPYITRALALAKSQEDDAGEGLALLAHARFDRLGRRTLNSQAMIESVIGIGKRRHDLPLLSQAHIAMGREFAARGQITSAENCFREAQRIVEHTDMRAFDLLAYRERLRLNEFHVH